MTEIFDALEICLQEMERGADLESVVSRFPEHAEELRPILQAAVNARLLASREPSPDAARRSRARVMQRAAELREAKVTPRRRVIPVFSRLAISFALAALFLASGTGLVGASASALPGENLYPVKRGWENIRLFFIFDPHAREMLKDEFENERLHEVNELLAEGRHELIQFAGVYMQVNGIDYISGLQVILPANVPSLANGAAVIVTGRTNAQGFIEISSIDVLPDGSVVPLGNPVEVEVESQTESAEGNTPENGAGSGSGGEAGNSQPNEYELNGTLQSVTLDVIVVNGMNIILDQTQINGQLCVGMEVEVKGFYADDGSFVAQEVKGEGQCAGSPSSGAGGNSNSGSNSNSGPNSNSNSNDNGSNSGSGSSGNSNSDDSSGKGSSNSGSGSGDDNSNDGGSDDSGGDNSGGGGGDD